MSGRCILLVLTPKATKWSYIFSLLRSVKAGWTTGKPEYSYNQVDLNLQWERMCLNMAGFRDQIESAKQMYDSGTRQQMVIQELIEHLY